MVVGAAAREQALALDGDVLPDPSGRGLRLRRLGRGRLPGALGAGAAGLPQVP